MVQEHIKILFPSLFSELGQLMADPFVYGAFKDTSLFAPLLYLSPSLVWQRLALQGVDWPPFSLIPAQSLACLGELPVELMTAVSSSEKS